MLDENFRKLYHNLIMTCLLVYRQTYSFTLVRVNIYAGQCQTMWQY